MKLCSYEPVGGKSDLAHLFWFLDKGTYSREGGERGGERGGGGGGGGGGRCGGGRCGGGGVEGGVMSTEKKPDLFNSFP